MRKNINLGVIFVKINKIIRTAATIYLAMLVVTPVISGVIKVANITAKVVRYNISKSEKIKEIKKDLELKKQGVITVDYQEIDD